VGVAELIAQVWPFDPCAFWRGFITGAMVVVSVFLIVDTEAHRNG